MLVPLGVEWFGALGFPLPVKADIFRNRRLSVSYYSRNQQKIRRNATMKLCKDSAVMLASSLLECKEGTVVAAF